MALVALGALLALYLGWSIILKPSTITGWPTNLSELFGGAVSFFGLVLIAVEAQLFRWLFGYARKWSTHR